jgi:hypothetical protein
LDRHAERVTRHESQELRLSNAWQDQRRALEAEVDEGDDPVAPLSLLAVLLNEIEEAEYQATVEVPIKLNETEKTEHDIAWRAYSERNTRLETQRGQAFSMIRGQCM